MNLTASHKKGQEVTAGQTVKIVCNAVLVVKMLSACLQIYPLDKKLQGQEM